MHDAHLPRAATTDTDTSHTASAAACKLATHNMVACCTCRRVVAAAEENEGSDDEGGEGEADEMDAEGLDTILQVPARLPAAAFLQVLGIHADMRALQCLDT
jgi:hypothetical protein